MIRPLAIISPEANCNSCFFCMLDTPCKRCVQLSGELGSIPVILEPYRRYGFSICDRCAALGPTFISKQLMLQAKVMQAENMIGRDISVPMTVPSVWPVIPSEPQTAVGSVVYFVRAGDRIKIGRSTDVQKRVSSLQTASAVALEMLGTVSEEEISESQIHTAFAKDRVRGEWFAATQELLDFIEDICGNSAADRKDKKEQGYAASDYKDQDGRRDADQGPDLPGNG